MRCEDGLVLSRLDIVDNARRGCRVSVGKREDRATAPILTIHDSFCAYHRTVYHLRRPHQLGAVFEAYEASRDCEDVREKSLGDALLTGTAPHHGSEMQAIGVVHRLEWRRISCLLRLDFGLFGGRRRWGRWRAGERFRERL